MTHEFRIFNQLPKISFEKCFNECSEHILGGNATYPAKDTTSFDKLLTIRDAMEKKLKYDQTIGFASVENKNHVRYIMIGSKETWKNKDDTFYNEFVLFGKDSNDSRSYIYDIQNEYELLGQFLKEQGFKWHRSTPIENSSMDKLFQTDLYKNTLSPYMERENSEKEYLHLL